MDNTYAISLVINQFDLTFGFSDLFGNIFLNDDL